MLHKQNCCGTAELPLSFHRMPESRSIQRLIPSFSVFHFSIFLVPFSQNLDTDFPGVLSQGLHLACDIRRQAKGEMFYILNHEQ